MKNTIDRGKVSEYFFAGELLARNITPCWPSTEMGSYDIVADTGIDRHRIQVKATEKEGQSVQLDMRRPKSTRNKREWYSKKDVDFIVAHVVSWNAWYIFPVGATTASVTVRPGSPDCKYSKYLAAWHLLDERLKSG